MNIGKNIKLYRNSLKMEQKDLAKLLCISDKTVSSWETGRTEPRMGMIERMSEIFGCSKLDLIDGNFTPEAQATIDHMRDRIAAVGTPRDTFWEDVRRDEVFIHHMRLLWSLSSEDKNAVYRHIKGLYLTKEEDDKKEDALSS